MAQIRLAFHDALGQGKITGRKLASPSLQQVSATNKKILPQYAGLISQDDCDRVLRQILGLLNYDGLKSATDTTRSGVAGLAQALGVSSADAPKTITKHVAQMLDLSNPGSPFSLVLNEHRDALLAPRPVGEKAQRIADNDKALKLACAILDKAMTPDAQTVERQVDLIEEIGEELTKKCELAHADGLQACLRYVQGLSDAELHSDKTSKALNKICDDTAKTIEKLIKEAFDTFKRRNEANLGYTKVSERLSADSEYQFVYGILRYTALSAALMFSATAGLGAIPGAGLTLSAISGLVTGYVANAVGQVGAARRGATWDDAQPFAVRSPMSPKPQPDMEEHLAEQAYIRSLAKIAEAASAELADPRNKAARDVRERVARLEAMGYAGPALATLAPELLALCEHLDLHERPASTAFETPMPPALRIARLLHRAGPHLPDLRRFPADRPMDPAQRRTVIAGIVEALRTTMPETRDLDASALIARIEHRGSAIRAESGGDARQAPLVPDRAMLFCGAPPLQALQETLLDATREFLQPAFSSSRSSKAGWRRSSVSARSRCPCN